MVYRTINGININIDEKDANTVFFPTSFIKNFSGSINDQEDIKKNIYAHNNNDRYFPLSVTWELTNKCCFNCGFCYIHRESNNESVDWVKGKIDRVVADLVSEGMLFCTITGGECLIDPNFVYLYRLLKEKGIIVSVFSNGYYLGTKELELFKELRPYKLEISIYGVEQGVFEKTTSTRLDYKVVLNNILNLKRNGIRVKCKTPITSLTSKNIVKIRQWCNENSIEYYISDELFDSYYGDSVDVFRTYDEVYKEAVSSKESRIRKVCNYKFNQKVTWDCSAGKYTGVIGSDGAFYPCMSSVGIPQYRFQFQSNILGAIENYRKTLIKEKNKALEFCNGCKACSVCELCTLSSLKYPRKLIEEKCKYYKELII